MIVFKESFPNFSSKLKNWSNTQVFASRKVLFNAKQLQTPKQSGNQTLKTASILFLLHPPCEKVIIVPDTNYVTSAIRKLMLNMPSPGSFQNVGLLI